MIFIVVWPMMIPMKPTCNVEVIMVFWWWWWYWHDIPIDYEKAYLVFYSLTIVILLMMMICYSLIFWQFIHRLSILFLMIQWLFHSMPIPFILFDLRLWWWYYSMMTDFYWCQSIDIRYIDYWYYWPVMRGGSILMMTVTYSMTEVPVMIFDTIFIPHSLIQYLMIQWNDDNICQCYAMTVMKKWLTIQSTIVWPASIVISDYSAPVFSIRYSIQYLSIQYWREGLRWYCEVLMTSINDVLLSVTNY